MELEHLFKRSFHISSAKIFSAIFQNFQLSIERCQRLVISQEKIFDLRITNAFCECGGRAFFNVVKLIHQYA